MNDVPGSGTRLAIGHCVFGTWEGHTVVGTGCFADASHELVAALEFRPQKLSRDEESWFVLPAVADGVPIKIIGLVRFARDFKQRDGCVGVAVAYTDKAIAGAAFSGPIYEVGRLNAAFRHFCIGKDDEIAFAKAGEIWPRLPGAKGGKAQVGGHEPLRLRLWREWYTYISLPELCRVLPQQFVDVGPRGFILRDAATTEFDHEIATAFLANWAEKQFGPQEQRAFEAHLAKTYQAFTDEKRKTSELSAQASALTNDLARLKSDFSQQLDAQTRQLTEARARLQSLSEEKVKVEEAFERKESEITKRYKALADQADRVEKAAAVQAQEAIRAKVLADETRSDLARVRSDLTARDGEVRSAIKRAETAEAGLEDLRRSFNEHLATYRKKIEQELGAKVQALSSDLARASGQTEDLRQEVSRAQGDVWEREQTIKELRKRLEYQPTDRWPPTTGQTIGKRPSSTIDQMKAIAASGLLLVVGGMSTAGAMKIGVLPSPVGGSIEDSAGLSAVKQKFFQLHNDWQRFTGSQGVAKQNLAFLLEDGFRSVGQQLRPLRGVACAQHPSEQRLAEDLATYKKQVAEDKGKTQAEIGILVQSHHAEKQKLEQENQALKSSAELRKTSVCPSETTAPTKPEAPVALSVGGASPPPGISDITATVNEPTTPQMPSRADPIPAPAKDPQPEVAKPDVAKINPAPPPQADSQQAAALNPFVVPTEPIRAKAQALLAQCSADPPPPTDKDFIGYGESLVYCLSVNPIDRAGRDACKQYGIGNYYGRLVDFGRCRAVTVPCPVEAKALPGVPKSLPSKFSPDIVTPYVNLLNCVIKTRQ